ncbi:MAG: MBL fold metallo-hydrolase [Bacteroidales bacterium]
MVKASEKEVVLIDTPYNTLATALMLDWVQQQLEPGRITAINTGFHVDKLGGNQYLREHGIDIYGADKTCELIDKKGRHTQQQLISWLTPAQEHIKQVYETMVFTKPNKTYKLEHGLFLRIGDLDFDVIFPGESHSPDNVVIYIKECNLLFGGCMVKALSANNLGFTGDANMSQWPLALKVVQERYPQAKVVIPHHGMWGDMTLVQHTIDLLLN